VRILDAFRTATARRRIAVLAAIMPFLVGAGLRLFALRDQIASGDELHAVDRALAWPAAGSRHFGRPTIRFYCALLPGLIRTVGRTTSGCGCRSARRPRGVGGAAALARRAAGAEGTLLLRWSLALAALRSLHALRAVRANLAAGQLRCVSVDTVRRRRATRDLLAYGAAGALCVWLLPVALPFVLAPLASSRRGLGMRRPRAGRADAPALL
jgi:hypothetical protein